MFCFPRSVGKQGGEKKHGFTKYKIKTKKITCHLFPVAFDKYLRCWLNRSAAYVRFTCSGPLLHAHCDNSASFASLHEKP